MKKVLLLIGVLLTLTACKEDQTVYLAGIDANIEINLQDETSSEFFVRGTPFYLDKIKDGVATIYQEVDGKKIKYNVDEMMIVENLDEVVKNSEVTITLSHNLRKDKDTDISDVLVKKGEILKIADVNIERDFNEDGTVDGYMVYKDDEVYYLDMFYTQQETLDKSKIDYSSYFDRYYGNGYAKKAYIDDITYLNVDRSEFENKPFNKTAKAVHVGMDVAIEQKDYLIQLCNETGLNALVIEIKSDSGQLIFKSDTSKHVYTDAIGLLEKEQFKQLLADYKAANIYLIGRVVTFKDATYAASHPDDAIQKSDGSLLSHNGEPWPSPYSRNVWRYIVGYSKEAVELGIDEIQFDYCRFPDGMSKYQLDYQNMYDETKTQAITNFLYYAREELRKVEGYISVDVFGWNMICGDDQDIGQFIPAIANVVDAISPMPYPDHFSQSIYGIKYPWHEPGELLKNFTLESMNVLNSIENPATYRTWIQGYACLSWVCKGTADNPKRSYGPSDMIDQIEGIREAGEDGYIVWSGNGGKNMFDFRKAGFIE